MIATFAISVFFGLIWAVLSIFFTGAWFGGLSNFINPFSSFGAFIFSLIGLPAIFATFTLSLVYLLLGDPRYLDGWYLNLLFISSIIYSVLFLFLIIHILEKTLSRKFGSRVLYIILGLTSLLLILIVAKIFI